MPHTHSEHVADPQQHVLQVLGLEATAASFEQQFTFNAGRRGAGIAQTTLHIGLPPDGSAGPSAGAYALLDRFADVLRRAGKGSGPLRVIGPNGKQGAVAAPWRYLRSAGDFPRLRGPAAAGHRAAEDRRGAPADLPARVADLVAAPLVDLAQRPALGACKQPLVLLLLRQALLAQAREVALQIAVAERLLDANLLARLGSGTCFGSSPAPATSG